MLNPKGEIYINPNLISTFRLSKHCGRQGRRQEEYGKDGAGKCCLLDMAWHCTHELTDTMVTCTTTIPVAHEALAEELLVIDSNCTRKELIFFMGEATGSCPCFSGWLQFHIDGQH